MSLREAIQVRLHQVPNLDLLAVAPRCEPLAAAAATETQPGPGLQLLVGDDLLRWQSGQEAVALKLLAPSLQLRSQSQADGAWMQVQRLLGQGLLQPLERWSPAALGCGRHLSRRAQKNSARDRSLGRSARCCCRW